jgi:hypothetical protein
VVPGNCSARYPRTGIFEIEGAKTSKAYPPTMLKGTLSTVNLNLGLTPQTNPQDFAFFPILQRGMPADENSQYLEPQKFENYVGLVGFTVLSVPLSIVGGYAFDVLAPSISKIPVLGYLAEQFPGTTEFALQVGAQAALTPVIGPEAAMLVTGGVRVNGETMKFARSLVGQQIKEGERIAYTIERAEINGKIVLKDIKTGATREVRLSELTGGKGLTFANPAVSAEAASIYKNPRNTDDLLSSGRQAFYETDPNLHVIQADVDSVNKKFGIHAELDCEEGTCRMVVPPDEFEKLESNIQAVPC